MVVCLLAKNFNAEAYVTDVAAILAKPEKTIHILFSLPNCIANDYLSLSAQLAQNFDQCVVESSVAGDNSTYWKLQEEHSNN
jgi:hypothetical protein